MNHGRLSLVLAALMALAAAAHAAPARSEAPAADADGTNSLRAQMASSHQQLEAALKKLEDLSSATYAKSPAKLSDSELNAAAKERAGLIKELREKQAALRRLAASYRTVTLLRAASEMQSVLSAGKRGASLDGKFAGILGEDDLYRQHSHFAASIDAHLWEDEEQFGNAMKVLDRRRLTRRFAAALATAVLLVAGSWSLWSFSWRRAAPPAAALSAPAGPPGHACAPASAAAVVAGNFQVMRELGRGAIGPVYEALDMTLQRMVILKSVSEELLRSPKELEALLGAAQRAASLRHPAIVEFHGVAREAGGICLVLEHAPGRPLSLLLQERGKLPLREVHALLAHAAAALDYAHSQGVVHGGLAPSNIMVTDDHKVKVLDFGLGRGDRAAAYSAPEQDPGAASRESDLYALCACVYELATGRPAFAGPDIAAQKREGRYPPPSEAAGLPPAFDAFIRKGLQPDPGLRYRSAAELLAALAPLAEA